MINIQFLPIVELNFVFCNKYQCRYSIHERKMYRNKMNTCVLGIYYI